VQFEDVVYPRLYPLSESCDANPQDHRAGRRGTIDFPR
jgi:hypothetical protein